MYNQDNVPDNLYYFQKHEFKYCFGSNTILHSVKFLAAYNKKASVVPGAASGQTILASEALSNIGEAINKAADQTKKRRLETLDREAIDNQNNDKTKQRRLESEAECLEELTNRPVRRLDTGLEDTETLTGDSGPSETVTVDLGQSASSEVEDLAPPPLLTPSKGIYLYLLLFISNTKSN